MRVLLSTEPVRANGWRAQAPSAGVQARLPPWCRAQKAGAMLADEMGPGVTHVIAPKDTSAQQASSKLQSAHVPSPVLVSKLLTKACQHCHQVPWPSCVNRRPLSPSPLKESYKQQARVRTMWSMLSVFMQRRWQLALHIYGLSKPAAPAQKVSRQRDSRL